MLRHYVEFLYPGIIVSESSAQWTIDRNIPVVMPENAFGYRFYDREEACSDDGETLLGKPKNYSGWYYEGRRMDFGEVCQKFPDQRILITNMRRNSIKEIVWTKFRQAIPLNPEDKILGEELIGQCVFFNEPIDTGKFIKPGTPVFDRPGGTRQIGEVISAEECEGEMVMVKTKITDKEVIKMLTGDNCKNFSVGGTTSGSVRKRAVPKVR